MNAEKFDIEKMLQEDAESIEIDLDFKAKLKANIMKNNSSFEGNNIIDFNRKTSVKPDNKLKDITSYKKYLKIASSFAIVGLIGFRVGVGNLGVAKVEIPNKIEVLDTVVYNVIPNNEAASANNSNDSKNEEGIKAPVQEVAKNSENDATNPDDQNKTSNSDSNENGVDETPSTDNNTDGQYVATAKDGTGSEQGNSNTGREEIPFEKPGIVDPSKETDNTETDFNEIIEKKDNKQFASGNTPSEDKDSKGESVLVTHAKENGLDLYYGTLTIKEDGLFSIKDNNVYIKNGDSEELIFAQEDNCELLGIKKINDNEVILYKGSFNNQEKKIYQLSKLNISSKKEKLLVSEADNISLTNTYDKLAFEINGNIVIKNIKTEKQEKTLNGSNIAWSSDGQYLSYVKTVNEKKEGEKIKTYSSLVVYNCEENEETHLTKKELIVKNDKELMGRYQYGENLWSNDNKCIYVVRDDKSIIIDTDGNQKQVIELIVEK
ncbi:hypothetical protein [Oceanirhabdus sp. W0125-5]|uniref:hypothetical protein n=1 Tax=Oceanirhabdus sp. W0125-5 TaxID=2999116 RepID=UPI0022F2D643|nr:hypothetical protein [Oceanirhabdus sp. W0125-5]WBW98791.1 hypothetical protein OW730_08530 [Oceanirhabdus sp. W0125-5]